MIISFKHKGLKDFFIQGNSSKLNRAHTKKLRLILAKLHAAHTTRDLNFPGSSLHQLTGELKGFLAISVNGNWRIVFKFEDGDASLVDYVDYH